MIFSASMNQPDMDRALALGAAAYTHKPVDLQAYRNVVLAMIDLWTDLAPISERILYCPTCSPEARFMVFD